ncbi:Serpin-ZX protein [Spatholobus suberectus]|nr:Serpin-ZX protein [Spatholobus suberectus]
MVFRVVEVANEVNSWTEKETNGLIKELLPPRLVDNSIRLIFANELYFKGAWNEKFDASMTEDFDFHLLNGSSVKVPFMTSRKQEQFIRAFDGFKVLGLPYKQSKDKHAKDGLSNLAKKWASKSGFLERKLPHEKVEIGDFRIPRFNISFGFEASNVLKELGVVLPFHDSDLTKMVESPLDQMLYVSKIFHKSFIEVNGEGTEVATATTAKIVGYAWRPTKIDFVADYPFLFVIREDLTRTILFIGQVLDPYAG